MLASTPAKPAFIAITDIMAVALAVPSSAVRSFRTRSCARLRKEHRRITDWVNHHEIDDEGYYETVEDGLSLNPGVALCPKLKGLPSHEGQGSNFGAFPHTIDDVVRA